MVSFSDDNGTLAQGPDDNDDTNEAEVSRQPPEPPAADADYARYSADPAFDESKAEFTTAFDIIDEMTSRLDEAKGSVFNPGIVKLERQGFVELLDELKSVLPVQLERASALMRESEKRLESAQSQADTIIASARRQAEETIAKANEQANFLAGRQNVVAIANDKARAILDTAQDRANKLTQGADDYSEQVLSSLQEQIEKLDRDVQGGLSVLRARRKDAASRLKPLSEDDYPHAS